MNARALKINLPLLVAFALAPVRGELLLKPNDVVAIGGDSITQQKRYSVLIEDYLLMCQPTTGLGVVEFGSNGAGAYVLGKNTPGDLELFKPTVVTMMFGMNDGQYKPLAEERSAGFRKGTQDSIDAEKKIGARVVLVSSPTCICVKGKKAEDIEYNATLKAFGEMAHKIATDNGEPFTDTHGIMTDVIAKGVAANPEYNLGGDGTHQGWSGHLVMAYSMLKGLGCDGALGTITVDLAKHTATGTPGQKIVSVNGGEVQVESTRYPFCFTGDPKDPATTANVIQYLPFNEDLNRYLLVVKGLTAAKAKVTWGSTTKEFTADQLAKGINLAAEFAGDNPFSAPFQKVQDAIVAQQTQETYLAKEWLSDMRELRGSLPGQDAMLDAITAAGMKERDRLAKAAADAVVPVQHTIKIEPES